MWWMLIGAILLMWSFVELVDAIQRSRELDQREQLEQLARGEE